MFRPAQPVKSRFRPSSIKWDTFWPARPKHLGLDQVWPSEIRFNRRDQNIYVSTKFNQARFVSTRRDIFRPAWPQTFLFWPSLTKKDTFGPARTKHLGFEQVRPSEIHADRRDQNIYVSTPRKICFDNARYVSTGTTTKFFVLTKFDQTRYVSTGANKTSMFRPSSTQRDTFWPARPKHLGFEQVPPSEIHADRRDQNIYVSTPRKICFDNARYVSTGTTTKFFVLTKFDQTRYVSTGANKTSMFRPSSTQRDTFWPARPKHLGFDQVRPNKIRFDRRDQNI